MKVLDRHVLKTFLRSFIVSFIIAVFVFLMNFIFVYLDDFVGKDINASSFASLFFYFSLNTIQRALPLSLLLASVMSMGQLAESLEIPAMLAGGISFFRITRPLVYLTILLSLSLLLLSNNILPFTNLKLQELLTTIRFSRPSLVFRPGSFNNDLRGFSFRAAKVNGSSLNDLLIYDHLAGNGANLVIAADSGYAHLGEKSGVITLQLFNGTTYHEPADTGELPESTVLMRDHFEERTLRIDPRRMFGNRIIHNFGQNHAMLSLRQISRLRDSLSVFNNLLRPAARTEREKLTLLLNDDMRLKYHVEWHKRLALATSCMVFLLAGLPLGYMIRKGGLGMPVLTAAALYILWHTLSITGEKLAEDENIPVIAGAWMANVILLALALPLCILAGRDKLRK